ncbi:MAG: CoA pyrophosphatase [Thermotogae bacterium]|nr:MAG: CoA pyrophosphatase [Thermotogota bacterium]
MEGKILKKAAVVVPIVIIEGEPYLILTRRSRKLNNHPGQISFPGGIWNGRETLIDTAFREMEEEIGAKPSSVIFLHKLEIIETLMSKIEVHPYAALLSDRIFKLNRDEVEEILFVKLSMFYKVEKELIALPSGKETIKYRLPGLIVWGATARIIDSSLEKVSKMLLNSGYINSINND